MPAYLTFDIGTTALKTALVSAEGRILALHTAEYTLVSPRPDWAEMPAEAYWDAAVEGARAVFAGSDSRLEDLAGIGFSSQGQTYIPIDENGRALYNAIVWVDNRAQYIADQWEADWLSREEYQRISGYPWVLACLSAFKIAWMKEHAPEAHRAWKFLCLPDYLVYRLTGVTATDRVIAQMSGLYDLQANDWSGKILQAAGISPDQLPSIYPPGTQVGRVGGSAASELRIPTGVPVCVGANDQLIAALGAGNTSPGIASETTGTALAAVMTTRDLLLDDRMFVSNHAVSGLCYALTCANTSAIVLGWLRDLCSPGVSFNDFLRGVENIPPGCDGLTVLPHFAGINFPIYNPNARGAIAGLTLGHTREHLARGIMESCACLLRDCLEPFADHGLQATSVRSLGGAARSDLWLQIKADMLGIPVERPECSDAASLGAAMLAAAGTGQSASVEDASKAWYRPAKVFDPNPSLRSVYEDVYGRYRELCAKLYGQGSIPT